MDAILNGNGNDDFEELMLDDIERDKQEPLELLDIPWMVDGLEGNLDGDVGVQVSLQVQCGCLLNYSVP